ncbi:hypothetical protein MMC28_009833 [Mycoblastus sanguinarius]|nr:hypothetical protein [Mycoblastus sanguinarius]
MRLLNTKTIRFEEFFDTKTPKYAVLSHRWAENEVEYHDFEESKKQRDLRFSKIQQCCSFAEQRGLQWVWIDTCCIDKKSSAELSEAINSMFRWYAGAEECYINLSDVLWVKDKNGIWEESKTYFRQSAWFTRGWKLQELLAPSTVIFLDRRWEVIGTKDDLSADISAVTRIEAEWLCTPQNLHKASVAKKMSWVSKRETSRVEDMAYSLLCMFDVNMPLLYGEGKKAFLRLQLEIIKKSDDESIFAWASTNKGESGLLATWPDSFAESGDISLLRLSNPVGRLPYSMTNKGLEFHVPYPGNRRIGQTHLTWLNEIPLALNCWRKTAEGYQAITIGLSKSGETWRRNSCERLELSTSVMSSFSQRSDLRTAIIYIHQDGL